MKALIMGAGAIGSLMGGFLAKAGAEVVLVGRRAHVEAVRSRGLRVEGPLGSFTVKVDAHEKPEEAKGDFDLVLITVKAYDTAEAAKQVKRLVEKQAVPLCLQNGLGVEEEASRVLGTVVFRGVTNNGAMLAQPGTVHHTGVGETLIGGRGVLMEKLVTMLNASGLPARKVDNIAEVVWIKTLVNAGINPLGAITGLRNGELLEVGWLRSLMKAVVEEGANIAKKMGVELGIDPVELTFKVAKDTANNKNSMLQDLERKKRTEVDYINGAIVKAAQQVGMEAPLNEALTKLVKAMEGVRWRN